MKKMKKSTDSKEKKYIAESYNKFKTFEGKFYTGMKVGRGHTWIHEPGEWKEKKLTPDKWEIRYAVMKRRKGKAPEGSGVPVGTKYHWYILAHQIVEKLNANDYSTDMVGLKFKIAHQRAHKEDWNISELAQKKRLVKILQELVSHLEEQIREASQKKTPKSGAIKHFPHKKILAKNEPYHEEKKTRKGRA